MRTKKLTDEELRHAYDLVAEHRSTTIAARILGIEPGALRHRYQTAIIRLNLDPINVQRAETGTAVSTAPQGRDARVVSVDDDREWQRARLANKDLRKRLDQALSTIDVLEEQLAAATNLGGTSELLEIVPKLSQRHSEGTVLWAASDWHFEEIVEPDHVNDLNAHNPDIAHQRAQHFFSTGMRLTNILQKDCKINNLLLFLGGDFITGDIHDELVESNAMTPMEAILAVEQELASGIASVLKHTDLTVQAVCKVGNHSRTTKQSHNAHESGHSLEYIMYRHLAHRFQAEKRVTFVVEENYHTYVPVYDKVLRFHHGHRIRYGGGVGGLYIPVNKKINQWNKGRWADLDVFGHFHQRIDGGNFLCNGSQIGYNAYALNGGFSYEPPSQHLVLLDRDRFRTFMVPIYYPT